jgi:hypothetical protein
MKIVAQNIQICPFYEEPKFAHFIKNDFTKMLPGSIKLGIFSKTKHILNPYDLAHRALMTPSLKVKDQGHIFLVKNIILNIKIEGHDIFCWICIYLYYVQYNAYFRLSTFFYQISCIVSDKKRSARNANRELNFFASRGALQATRFKSVL